MPGLSIGIACSLLIAIFVLNEACYDKFNKKKDRAYRLMLNGKIGGQEIVGAFNHGNECRVRLNSCGLKRNILPRACHAS
ncbi:MAG: hypothetical protein WAV93_10805 [Bacteroidales bacterium]